MMITIMMMKREVTRDKAIIVTDTLLIRVSCSFSFPVWTKDNNNDDNDNDDDDTTTTTTDKEYFRSPIFDGPIALTKSTEDKEGGWSGGGLYTK